MYDRQKNRNLWFKPPGSGFLLCSPVWTLRLISTWAELSPLDQFCCFSIVWGKKKHRGTSRLKGSTDWVIFPLILPAAILCKCARPLDSERDGLEGMREEEHKWCNIQTCSRASRLVLEAADLGDLYGYGVCHEPSDIGWANGGCWWRSWLPIKGILKIFRCQLGLPGTGWRTVPR